MKTMLALKFSWKRLTVLLLVTFSDVFFSSTDATFGKIKMVHRLDSPGPPYYVPSESPDHCSEGGIHVESVSVLKPEPCSGTRYSLTITDDQFLKKIRSFCDERKSCSAIFDTFYYNNCGRYTNRPLPEFEISYTCIYSHIFRVPTDAGNENELCSGEKGGKAILVRAVYIHKPVACQSDQGGFYLKDKQLAQYQLVCNGKSRCDYRYAPHFTCHTYSDTHAFVPDKTEVFYTCLPVEPNGNKVFSMTENFTTTRHRAVTYETTMLVMEASAGMLTERQCVASGTNVRLTMKVLQLDIGQTANRGACTGWFKSSTTNSVTSDKEIRCSDLETIDDFDQMTVGVSPEKSYIKVQVSMTSGFVWLQLLANQPYTLRCDPLPEKVVDGRVVTSGPFPPERSTRRTTAPESLTRKTTAPESLTRRTTAPESLTRKTTAPESLTRRTTTSESLTRKTTAPESLTRKTTVPESLTRKTTAPESLTRKTTAPESLTRKTPWPVKEGGQKGTNSDNEDNDSNNINVELLIIVFSVVLAVAIIIVIILCSLFFCCLNSPLHRWASKRRQQQQETQLQQVHNGVRNGDTCMNEGQEFPQESCHIRFVPEFHAAINNTTVSYSNTVNSADANNSHDDHGYIDIIDSPSSSTTGTENPHFLYSNTLP